MEKVTLRELFEDFVSLVFPNVCIHCRIPLVSQEEYLCTGCRLSFPKTNYSQDEKNPLLLKFVSNPKVKGATSFLHYQKGGVAQSIIREIKYAGHPDLAEMAGRWFGNQLKELNWPVDGIVPVPLHASKFKKRGFNQSEHLANGIAEILEIPVLPKAVVRVTPTSTQTKRSKVARWLNVEAIYRLDDEEAIDGKNLLIVDDVLTTGATLGELLEVVHPAREIYIGTFASGR